MKQALLIGVMMALTGCISSQEAAAPSKVEQIKARYDQGTKAYLAVEEECKRQLAATAPACSPRS
jgi:hypothetical protein